MASTDVPKVPKRPQMQVCDNCRFRKTKCDRGLPCASCVASSISCQYLHTPRRKGPRGGKGRRLLQIKQGLKEFDELCFSVSTPSQIQLDLLEMDGRPPPRPEAIVGSSSLSHPSAKRDRDQLIATLTANVRCFMRRILPIMPVLDETEIMDEVQRFDKLALPRQVLILSLCAVTRIQLKLDQRREADGSAAPVNTSLHAPLTGRGILAAAKRLRRQFDILDYADLNTIVTSYLLFTAHGNLEEHLHALFHLNEAITLVFALGLDNEETYSNLDATERERRRRIFWLLFVTERTYALQRRHTIMLRSTISKPQVVDSDCPIMMHDFVNHIRLFELLPPALYDWRPSSDPLQPQVSSVALSQRVADLLCTVQASDSVLESQQFDTLITQQWLRVSMWRLAFGQASRQLRWHAGFTGAKIPFEAGRSIMGQLEAVSSTNKDCHGISIEQKLFDIGISISDASYVTPQTSFFELGPVDLLYSIIKCLGHIRGTKSPLLPELLKHCGDLLPYSSPAPQLSMSSTLYASPVDSSCRLVMDGESASTDEMSPHESWNQGDAQLAEFEEIGQFIDELPCEVLAFDESASVN